MTTSIVVTESIELNRTRAPALPFAPVEYDRQYADTLNNILRQYFNTLDNFVSQLSISAGGSGAGLYLPNGAFSDSTTQTAVSTTVAYPITFNTTDYSSGVALESTSRLKVTYAGRYNLQFSIQLQNTTNAPVDIDVWVRKNGTNIAASNSRFGLPARKNPSDPFHVVAALNILVDLQANEYVELVWCTGDVGAGIKAYTAGTSPTRPAIPSVIATMTFVSAI